MPQVLLTYDVSGRQTDVKNELKKINYVSHYTKTGDETKKRYYLPDTTLLTIGDNKSATKAMQDLKDVVAKLNQEVGVTKIRIERAKSVEYDKTDQIQGEPLA